jgi:hypothetical protein
MRQIIEYSTLLKELDIDSVRVLEDLIIETIYAVSEFKLNQGSSCCFINYRKYNILISPENYL